MKPAASRRFPLVALVSVTFVIISLVSLSVIQSLQGNARVVNYAGIVRGATQRLVKQELQGLPNDPLIRKLDGIIGNLVSGRGENQLVSLPSAEYQLQLEKIVTAWKELKGEIIQVRQGADSRRLFDLSETYFVLADDAVALAEGYSEQQARHAKGLLLGLYFGVLGLVGVLSLYNARQKKMSEALQEAENASREKSRFLSSMSHEIRTPMNGIMGMTAIAKMHLENPRRVRECLEQIEQCSGFLLSLINDVLDMARIESGRVVLRSEPFGPAQLVEGLRAMFLPQAREKAMDFEVRTEGPMPAMVTGDGMRLKQILTNLLSNALKFTPSGGKVTLLARSEGREDGLVRLRFEVSDNGVGMSESFMERMYDPFEQEDSVPRQSGGTGLGLAISHRLIDMMGGSIEASSRLGEGSRFTVRLSLPPAEPQPQAPAPGAPPSPRTPSLSGLSILLAEDNSINAEIAAVLLEVEGARVRHVWNGREAVEAFSRSLPGEYDLILMDIQMPEMSGLAAARAIRELSHADAGRIPILALTANAFNEDAEKALDSGMNGHLAKPIDMQLLRSQVQELLGARAAIRPSKEE